MPDTTLSAHSRTTSLPWQALKPSTLNSRKAFDPAQIEELANSIAEVGILQNLVVRPLAGDSRHYEILAGERRYRAVSHLIDTGARTEMDELPVRIVDPAPFTGTKKIAGLDHLEGAHVEIVDDGKKKPKLKKTVAKKTAAKKPGAKSAKAAKKTPAKKAAKKGAKR